jgi:hypothetical protein
MPVVMNLAAATTVKIGPGTLIAISVTTTGPCTAHDTTGSAAAGTLLVTTPTAVGVTQVNIPFMNGLLITPTGAAAVYFE